MNKNSTEYAVDLTATNDLLLPYFVNVKYSKGGKKELSNSYSDNLYPKDVIGELPLVVLSPDFKEITFGSPQARRDLIDRILSQSHKIYLDDWLKLKKILKQRSSILLNFQKTRQIDNQLFDVWTNILIEVSASIIFRRSEFIKSFAVHFKSLYKEL